MNRFSIEFELAPGVQVLTRKVLADDRGSFQRLFDLDDLTTLGWDRPVAQVNQTITRERGTVRGLHFQHPPFDEWKLVTCLEGEILDLIVDIRRSSVNFLTVYQVKLDGNSPRSLLIPPGFAHGFQTLSSNVVLNYCHSQPYVPHAEGGLNVQDPRLAISWPLPITQLSDRDRQFPMLTSDFNGVDR